MERRKFLRNGGLLASFFGAGVAVATETVAPVAKSLPVPVKEDISHLVPPPPEAATIQITGAYGEKPKPQVVSSLASNSFYINGFNQETTHKVSMSVGLDNRLWIKVGAEWHWNLNDLHTRVTES